MAMTRMAFRMASRYCSPPDAQSNARIVDDKRQLPMSNPLSTNPIPGTRDFYPDEMSVRAQVFAKLYQVVESFGYARYDGPMLEPLELYTAKSSEEIVGQQTYRMTDRGGRELVVRPEMTPTVARMIAAKAGSLSLPARWYSHPNL